MYGVSKDYLSGSKNPFNIFSVNNHKAFLA